jgi:hypothetical protein
MLTAKESNPGGYFLLTRIATQAISVITPSA